MQLDVILLGIITEKLWKGITVNRFVSIAVNVLFPATSTSPDYGKESHQKHITLLQDFIPNTQ